MKSFFVGFINFRLIGIHAGIQGGHCAGELFTDLNQSRYTAAQKKLAHKWLNEDKIFIFLHAGQSADLLQAYRNFTEMQDDYPTALFREEPAAFGDGAEGAQGAVTAWGIVIPENVFAARYVSPPEENQFSKYRTVDGIMEGPIKYYYDWFEDTPEYELLKYKSQWRLAY
jgi:hypothetical protein